MNRIQTLLSLAKEELYAAEILLENTPSTILENWLK